MLVYTVRNGSNNKTYKSRVCATLKPGQGGQGGRDDYCAVTPLPSSTASTDTGTSESRSFVKTTNHTSWTTSVLYVKPGDSVYFCHDYWPRAQEVRTTTNWPDILDETASNSPLKPDYPGTDPGTNVVEYEKGTTATSSYTFSVDDYTNIESKNVTAGTRTRIEASYPSNSGKTYTSENTNKFKINITYPHSDSTTVSSTTYGTIDGVSDEGTAGKKDSRMKESGEGVISTTAVGGELKQAVTSYAGTLTAEKRNKDWTWTYKYNCQEYELVTPEAPEAPANDPTPEPTPCTGFGCLLAGIVDTVVNTITTVLENLPQKQYSDPTICTNGSGSGTHGSDWYRRASTSAYTEKESSSAMVRVPYNYEFDATIEMDSNKRIYSGESLNIKRADITTLPHYNTVTGGNYATKTQKIKTTLTVFSSATDLSTSAGGDRYGDVSGCSFYPSLSCSDTYSTSDYYNESGDLNGQTEQVFDTLAFNAFDIPAGYYMCVGLSLYPSGTNTNDMDMELNGYGNNTTRFSRPACQKVYKKPSFAVWGGSLFSNGSVSTTSALKRNIQNYGTYSAYSTTRRRMFSPWVEGLVVANGSVNNLASGAATGYSLAGTIDTNYQPIAAPGGIRSSDYCELSRLTIANSRCDMKTAGSAGLENNTEVRDEIYGRYVSEVTHSTYVKNGTSLNLTSSANYTQVGTKRYTQTKSGATITQSQDTPLTYGTTHIVYSPGDLTIASNLTYPTYFASANQVPQYIIYAKGNINILQDVTEINGIIISEGTLNTCSNLTTTESDGTLVSTGSTCDKRLKINGSVIADYLVFNRVYGASVGGFSAEPAEIIDYNPSLYLWSSSESRNDISQDIVETYIHELAPRQ